MVPIRFQFGSVLEPQVRLEIGKSKDRDSEREPYGELGNVRLTPAEKQKLIERMGLESFEYYVTNLDLFIGQNGRRYKSHYATLLNWYRKDHKKTEEPKNGDPYAMFDFSRFNVGGSK